jgi:hypothetical protein
MVVALAHRNYKSPLLYSDTIVLADTLKRCPIRVTTRVCERMGVLYN